MKKHKESKSYTAVLKAAQVLFWKYGISRVSVEEICQEAGVSKMTFYRYFTNKTAVALAVMENFLTENRQIYRKIMAEEDPFSEKIKAILLLKEKGASGMSKEFLKDFYQIDDQEIKNKIETHRRESLAELRQDWKNAQEQGWIRRNLQIDFIMYMLDQMTAMMNDSKLIDLYPTSESLIMELTHFMFYGILSEDNTIA